ncbi:MAG: DNA-binding protein [Bryobacterales bacterium]|nr:DNA-binding protein [Bryobacterales bacterium]
MAKTEVRTPQKFLTEHEVAEILGVSVNTLRSWRLLNKGPLFRKFGANCRYGADDVAAYTQSAPCGGGRAA